MKSRVGYEKVAVSSRVRLARNFADYPFPGRLIRDKHAEELAAEIIRLVGAQLDAIDDFRSYDMRAVSEETAAFLVEKSLISRDLLNHRAIAAAFVHGDENISVMVNEEDHIREQCFAQGFDLQRAYERVCGIDDAISESLLFAYDARFGYLTACPTNLGTGLRASVMLFLPALSRRGILKKLAPDLARQGYTLRGTFGEGSGGEGDLYQISNEVTLGVTEEEILNQVEEVVKKVCELEAAERRTLLNGPNAIEVQDECLRAYGILTNCAKISAREFIKLTAKVKLGACLGFIDIPDVSLIDDLVVKLSPSNIAATASQQFTALERDIYRAKCCKKEFEKMKG